MQLSLTRSSDVAQVEVRYGAAPDKLTHKVVSNGGSLVPLPRLGPKEIRYVVAVALNSKCGAATQRPQLC
ncbi:MAG: hypothetical protein U0514_03785 [Candidatus Andersenbacteria bacterium]